MLKRGQMHRVTEGSLQKNNRAILSGKNKTTDKLPRKTIIVLSSLYDWKTEFSAKVFLWQISWTKGTIHKGLQWYTTDKLPRKTIVVLSTFYDWKTVFSAEVFLWQISSTNGTIHKGLQWYNTDLLRLLRKDGL